MNNLRYAAMEIVFNTAVDYFRFIRYNHKTTIKNDVRR